jgi:hypothetical protein
LLKWNNWLTNKSTLTQGKQMKIKTKLYRVAVTVALTLVYSGVSAETVYYPADRCQEIVSFEFSSGNGDTSINQVDILCVDADGKYTGYVGSWGSVAGLFGLGRAVSPEQFEFVPYGENTVTVTK